MPALQGPTALNEGTEPKPLQRRTGAAFPPRPRSQHRKGRTDLSRREEEGQAEGGSGPCSSCAPAFPSAFDTQTRVLHPRSPQPRCRPPRSNRHPQVPPQRTGSAPPARAPTFVAQLDVQQAVDAVDRVLANAGQGVGAARGEERDQHAEVVEGDDGLRGDNRGHAGGGERGAAASGAASTPSLQHSPAPTPGGTHARSQRGRGQREGGRSSTASTYADVQFAQVEVQQGSADLDCALALLLLVRLDPGS